MFYGFKNESKKKLSQIRKETVYMPWQKGVYGGEISI